MVMTKQQGLGMLRAFLVLVGVSLLCNVAVGVQKGNDSLDQRGLRRRHQGTKKQGAFALSS